MCAQLLNQLLTAGIEEEAHSASTVAFGAQHRRVAPTSTWARRGRGALAQGGPIRILAPACGLETRRWTACCDAPRVRVMGRWLPTAGEAGEHWP